MLTLDCTKSQRLNYSKDFWTAVPTDLVKVLKDESLYNRHALPTQEMGIPTNVSIQMYIEGMSSFKAQSMVLQTKLFILKICISTRTNLIFI